MLVGVLTMHSALARAASSEGCSIFSETAAPDKDVSAPSFLAKVLDATFRRLQRQASENTRKNGYNTPITVVFLCD